MSRKPYRNPSVMTHDFSKVPSANIQRSMFNRSSGYKTTFDAGYLVPFFVDEALPGDTFHNAANTGLASANALRTQYQTTQDKVLSDYLKTPTGAESARTSFDNKTGGNVGLINSVAGYLDRVSGSNSSHSAKGVKKGIMDQTITIPRVNYSTDVSPYR